MSILDDVAQAFRAIADESMPRVAATIHHPNCPCAKPLCVTASWARAPTVADCTCGGSAFPVPIR